jgi:uncharacterized protein YbjT (DUF2867 family)
MNSDKKFKALVFGAGGYIGSNLTPRLLFAGWQVRVAARHRAVLEARGWQGAEIVAADALRPESLRAAMQDIDVAFYLVHSMAAGRNFVDLDIEAARNFATAAAQAGVGRIVYLGGLLPDDRRYLHRKPRVATGDVLREGPVPVTEIRAGLIIGPGSAAYEIIRDLVNYLPVMITPSWVQSRSAPIALDDLLDYLVGVARLPEAAGKSFEVGGPEVLTYEQLMRQYGEITGKRFRLLSLPVLTPRLSSWWLKLVTTVPTSIARSLIDGLTNDAIANDEEIRKLIPLELRDFKLSVRKALEAEQSNNVCAHWAEGSIVCRNFHPEYAYYAKRAGGGEVKTWASANAVWRQVAAFGGGEGYYHAESLWFLRRLIDWFAGGPSFGRRRRHPTEVRVGDVIDAWRVIAAEPGRRLTLLMEMRGPGSGVLEFVIRDKGDYRTLRIDGYWHPAGPAGLLYWYILLPAHGFTYRGLTAAIAHRAEKYDGPVSEVPSEG